MRHFINGLLTLVVIVMAMFLMFSSKEPVAMNIKFTQREAVSPSVSVEGAEDAASADLTSGDRAPASDEVVRELAEEEVNTLTQDPIQRYDLVGNKAFTNKYGEFFVEVTTDPHDEDKEPTMKFFVKCKDNRPVKTGLPPARELITGGDSTSLSTCQFKGIDFVETNEGDSVIVRYRVNEVVRATEANADKFCNKGKKKTFNFPELCEKWNPGAFTD